MRQLSKKEVGAVLAGYALPAELLCGESLASYFSRLYMEANDELAKRDAQIAALNAKLSRYSMSAGEADQRMCESRAVRVALGFAANAENVAPCDLVERINALTAENVALMDAVKTHSQSVHFCEACGKDDPCETDDVCMILDKTPATDAAANALRAEGAIAARNALVAAENGADIYATVTAVIDQLREGKA